MTWMHRHLALLPLALVAFFPSLLCKNLSAQDNPTLGINLAGPKDWNTEIPFVDVFRMSRPWISQREGAAWGKGPSLELDRHGWVKRLAPNCYAETILCSIQGGHYPSGSYTIRFDGKGKLDVAGAAKITKEAAGKLVINVDSSRGQIFLRIRQTDPNDYIRNLKVLMPRFEDVATENPWHPSLLERWKGFTCIRFMDFMHTNGSEVTSWDDRPTIADATWSVHGVPLEIMCDLANRLNADPWFCIPHLADDDYVRQFAKLAKKLVKPSLKVYIEFSNEVWNSQFAQHKYSAEQGQKQRLAEKPWEAAWNFTALRSVEIFKIFEQEFGHTNQLIRVLPSQSANPYVSKQILASGDAYKHADALAIAPYVSMNVKPDEAATVISLGVDGVLEKLEEDSLPNTIEKIKEQKAIADQYGLKLIAYEAGQHMVGVRGAENNEALTHLLITANQDKRMGNIYRQYLQAWDECGGQLMCLFSSISRWGKYGSWGLAEYYDDSPHDHPKFDVALEFAERWNRE